MSQISLGLGRFLPREFVAWLRPRPLTLAEISEDEAEAQARAYVRKHHGELQREARKYADAIIRKLIDLNVCYRLKKTEASPFETIQAVKFRRPYVLTPEAIYLEIDLRPGNSPRGIGVDDLSDDKVLKNLAVACEHPVYFKYHERHGCWYIIEREVGKRGIPVHVKYDDILAARPASADGLSLPIGIGENKRPIYRSLGQMYSMLVAGTIGGGKSNYLSVLLCTLMRYNSPKRLQLFLIDLKGGVEFSFYQGVPHLMQLPAAALKPKAKTGRRKIVVDAANPTQVDVEQEVLDAATILAQAEAEIAAEAAQGMVPAIVERREQVAGALGVLVREGERRNALLKKAKVKSIGQYNHHNRAKALPHIICVIDEWADVKLEKDTGHQCEELLINIAQRFRAVGIHVILCTQTPNKEVVSIRIKNAMPARLVFNCPDQFSSMLVLNDASAYGLEPAGRSYFVWGGQRHEVQTPYINNGTVESIVAQAIGGRFNEIETTTHDVTDEEILQWAISSNNGNLDFRSVFTNFRLRGLTQDQSKAICASFEGQEVVVGASSYKVLPGSGSKARRLIPVDEAEGTQAQAGPTNAATKDEPPPDDKESPMDEAQVPA